MSARILLALGLWTVFASPVSAQEKRIKVLFLGDNGHHRPAERFRQLQPVFDQRGIDLIYTDRVDALNDKTLATYDSLMIFANTTEISPEQEKALLSFVENGKGFVPLHCASFCFLNSPKYIELVGAQFQKHGTGVFRTVTTAPDHPIMKGCSSFESWDETYLHTKHNTKGRTVLEIREGADGKEPWTWVREQGKGRVFYTAWGHDERTWSHPGFQNLVERGVRWSIGQDLKSVPVYVDQPKMTTILKDLKPFEFVEANIPFYPPSPQWGTIGEPIKKMQMPLPPAESMQHYVHPEGFELKLFASEELLGGKPIAMAWDERGRLWLSLTRDYPNELQLPGKGRDRIVIVEDTDGDGVGDKVKTFADKLSIPTSLTFANGGVIIHQAPDTLFFKDTTGDDVADERKVLFTGWHTNDTHAGPSNLTIGPDNWIYGMVGYAGFDGIVGGEKHSFRTGFYRFKSDGSKMEFLRNTNNNSWGVGFNEEGILFGSTANGFPSVYMPIPNRFYENVRGWSSKVLDGIALSARYHPITTKIRQVDHHNNFTSAAGHALYTARTYPKEYWNNTAFVTDPTGHLVSTFKIQPNGADFVSRYGWNLLAGDDEWHAPIAADVGPDGNVWVLDWYNYIVQHNPTPRGFQTGKGNAYETELRDKKHGRIYRLVYTGAKKPEKMSLHNATPEQLVSALKSDNLFWRRHAQRLLVERGKIDVVPALLKMAHDSSVDEIGLNTTVIHALWTLHGLKALDRNNTANLNVFTHRSAGVRRNALMVVGRDQEGYKAVLGYKLLQDPDAQVRLAAALLHAELPMNPESARDIVLAMKRPENMNDRWLRDALTAAAAKQEHYFLMEFSAQPQSTPTELEIVRIVAEHFARGDTEQIYQVIFSLTTAEPAVAETIIAGMSKGWPKGKKIAVPDITEQHLAEVLKRMPVSGRGELVRLGLTWGSRGFEKQTGVIVESLIATLNDDKQTDSSRIAAAKQLLDFRPDEAMKLLDLVTPRTSPVLATGLIEAVSIAPGVGKLIVERYPSWSPGARIAGLRALLGRAENTIALLDAIDANKIQLTELSLDQKQALAVHPDAVIAKRAKAMLSRGGALPSADRQKVLDDMLAITKKIGDATGGKAVFKKHCATCHQHSGEGQNIGPDLTGMAAHPKDELLVHILDPNRSVEGNFRVYQVEMRDGRLFTGLLASETRTSIELIDAQAKRFNLQRTDIEELTGSTKSLMPEGFEKTLTQTEFVDLLEFMTQRGKFLPLPLTKVATIVSTRGMFNNETDNAERLIFPDWKPKVFEGVPFVLVDPQGDKTPNVVMLYGPQGKFPPTMPKTVSLPCNGPVKTIHMLSGVSGWGSPIGTKGSVTMIVRLHYADGKTEDHELRNGEHFADYITRVDVPGSKFAYALRGQQIRYLTVSPKRKDPITRIELVKGSDRTAPVVMAITIESPE